VLKTEQIKQTINVATKRKIKWRKLRTTINSLKMLQT